MQPEEDSLRQRRDLLHRRRPDSSMRQVPQVALQLELGLVLQAGLLLRVLLVVAAAVQARDLWQAVAELLPPDSSAPAQPDSCHRSPEAELAQTKPTRTRVKRDR
jgi:hypothetical protein